MKSQLLLSRGTGFFPLLDKEVRARKIVREFSKDLLGEIESESKAGTPPVKRGPRNREILWEFPF
jgi:hypothetical protein